MNELLSDMIADAERAIENNPRHDRDSLYMLIGKWYPQATDEQVWEAVYIALGDG